MNCNAPLTEDQARARLDSALAEVSLSFGVQRTEEILAEAVSAFKKARRVAGAHGYGYRR